MRTFDANGKRYIEINGKTFFLLRLYMADRARTFVFLQVFGTAPLTKDDLPDKAWSLIATRGPEGRIFTAWRPRYFEPASKERLFVGATTAGSVRLLLGALYPEFPAEAHADIAASAVPTDRYGGRFEGVDVVRDEGSSGQCAARISNHYLLRQALEARTNGQRKAA